GEKKPRALWIFTPSEGWRKSRFQPPCVGRFGPWIYSGDTVPQEVLADDGRTWIPYASHSELRRMWQASPCVAELPLHVGKGETTPAYDWGHLLEWSYDPAGIQNGWPKSPVGTQPSVPPGVSGSTGTIDQCGNDPLPPYDGPEDCRWA